MTETPEPLARNTRSAVLRIGGAIFLALGFSLGCYLLLEAARPQSGLISFSFLLVLPAAISAFVAYVGDPWAERSRRFYLMVPVWLLLAVIVASIFLLHEGVICILLLSPLWLISGVIGTLITYRLRNRLRSSKGTGRTYCMALFMVPVGAMQAEPYVPLPADTVTVTRSIIVDATPQRIWPLLRGIPDVRPGEGAWNISQDVIGIPRPVGARLVGQGIGADRFADWGPQVKFRERITDWQPGRTIGWRFIFDDMEGWKFTDRHLMPDSPYFRVTTGGYRMEWTVDGKIRLTLKTNYWVRTPVNTYSALWGELFLGDVENNLLALVKQRAERR